MAQTVDYNLAAAIGAKWDGTTALTTGSPGGLHRDRVKADAAGATQTAPYTVFTIKKGRSRNVLNSDGSVVDHRIVIFMVYGDSIAADAVAATLRSTFHGQPLTNASPAYTAMSVLEYQDDLGQLITDERRSGDTPWQAMWTCEVRSQI